MSIPQTPILTKMLMETTVKGSRIPATVYVPPVGFAEAIATAKAMLPKTCRWEFIESVDLYE